MAIFDFLNRNKTKKTPEIMIVQIEKIYDKLKIAFDEFGKQVKQSKYYEAYIKHTINILKISSTENFSNWYSQIYNKLLNSSDNTIEERRHFDNILFVITASKLRFDKIHTLFTDYGGYKIYFREKILEMNFNQQAVHLFLCRFDPNKEYYAVYPCLFLKNPELTILNPVIGA